jgi:hypothetical protein
MKKIVQQLTEIINPHAVIGKSPLLRIEESNADSKCRYVQFKQMQGQYFVFKLDDLSVGRISNYLNNSNVDINKGCDAIIYAEVNQRKYILLIELKSESQSGITKAKKQLINSEFFVNYLNELIKHYGKIRTDNIEKRYLIFCTRPSAPKVTDKKQKIKPRIEHGRKIYLCKCNEDVYIDGLDLT